MAYLHSLKDRRALWILAALCSPFLAVLVSQVLRGNVEFGAYDAPSRPLLAGLVFLSLIERRIDFVKTFQLVCPISVFLLAIELASTSITTSLWGGRWATYFVDPLSLGQYAMLLGFFCLLSIDLVGKDALAFRIFKFAAFLTGVAISIATASRSGWVAVPVLFAIWLVVVLKVRQTGLLMLGVASFFMTCIVLYFVVGVIHTRVDAAIMDYTNYFDGHDRDTSAGLRLSMVRAAWHMFLEQPLYGYGDGHFPLLSTIPATASYNSQLLEFSVAHHGMHNELLQNILRSGVFGLIAFVLMFGVPGVFFARATRCEVTTIRTAGVIGLTYIAAVFCFGLNTEVSNLKYLASFYGLMVAACAAQIIWAEDRVGNEVRTAKA